MPRIAALLAAFAALFPAPARGTRSERLAGFDDNARDDAHRLAA